MSNNLSAIANDSPLNLLKSTKPTTNTYSGDTSFQQVLQTEIGSKLPATPERPAPASKPNTNSQSARNENKTVVNKSATNSNPAPASNAQSGNVAAPATSSNSEASASKAEDSTSKPLNNEQSEPDQPTQAPVDPNTAAQLLAMTGITLPAATPPGTIKNSDDNSNLAPIDTSSVATDTLTALPSAAPQADSSKLADAGEPHLALPGQSATTTPLSNQARIDTGVSAESKPTAAATQNFELALETASANSALTPPTDNLAEVKVKPDSKAAASTEIANPATSTVPLVTTDTTPTPKIDQSASTNLAEPVLSKPDTAPIKASAENSSPSHTEDNKLPATPVFSNAIAAPSAQHEITNVAKAMPLSSDAIAAKVGTTAWDRAVGQKVVWMVGSAIQSAELSLNPPDLGPLQVVLSVSNDQASASFSAAQPEVREALESAMPRLKQMLNDAGVQLSGFSVSAESQSRQQYQPQQSGRNPGSAGITAPTEASAVTTATAVSRQESLGMVDTFA